MESCSAARQQVLLVVSSRETQSWIVRSLVVGDVGRQFVEVHSSENTQLPVLNPYPGPHIRLPVLFSAFQLVPSQDPQSTELY